MTKFQEGDYVRCDCCSYSSLTFGHRYRVLGVTRSAKGNELLTLKNKHSPYGTSDYDARNFTLHQRQENAEMAAYEATKFFAVKLRTDYREQTDYHEQTDGLALETIQRSAPGDMSLHVHSTPLRSHRTQVQSDVKARIAEGDRWLVVQTICLIEGEEPRPPIRVTEYK